MKGSRITYRLRILTKTIEDLLAICKDEINAITKDAPAGIATELEVPGGNISSISVRSLIVVVEAAKFYVSIGKAIMIVNMHYTSVLVNPKI